MILWNPCKCSFSCRWDASTGRTRRVSGHPVRARRQRTRPFHRRWSRLDALQRQRRGHFHQQSHLGRAGSHRRTQKRWQGKHCFGKAISHYKILISQAWLSFHTSIKKLVGSLDLVVLKGFIINYLVSFKYSLWPYLHLFEELNKNFRFFPSTATPVCPSITTRLWESSRLLETGKAMN